MLVSRWDRYTTDGTNVYILVYRWDRYTTDGTNIYMFLDEIDKLLMGLIYTCI